MQSRWNSPVLKTAIGLLVVYAFKEFLHLEVSNEIVNNAIDLLFLAFFGIAAANNPESKDKF